MAFSSSSKGPQPGRGSFFKTVLPELAQKWAQVKAAKLKLKTNASSPASARVGQLLGIQFDHASDVMVDDGDKNRAMPSGVMPLVDDGVRLPSSN